MKKLAAVVVCVLLPALGAVTAGCGGDDKGDLSRYYRRLDGIFQYVADGLEVLEARAPEPGREAGIAASFFKAETELWRVALIEELGAVDPPVEVVSAHEDLVRTGASFHEQLDFTRDHYSSVVESTAKAEVVSKTLLARLDAARERFEDACRMLQAIAKAEDVDVELGRQVAGLDCDL